MWGEFDLHTKELVGYCLYSRMTADIVVQALTMAIKRRKPTKGLIVHSDRGSQYCSHAYRDLIAQHEYVGSMSAKGNCYDNAPIESFWATLKMNWFTIGTMERVWKSSRIFNTLLRFSTIECEFKLN